ncbi:MAG TPA: DUF4433 domain-containing protein [Emticicia sp.]
MMINKNRAFCYRIIHRDNLDHLLDNGILNKHHRNIDINFVTIGNLEIIDVRSTTAVRLNGYGCISEYVPFYFTPRSIMLYNIVTGYYAPKVPKRNKDEIIVIRCLIEDLVKCPEWFFTDGQANDGESIHYNDLAHLDQIDWNCIQNGNFSKSDGDYDRQRRYQAEFLVRDSVPIECVESISVYNDTLKDWAENKIKKFGLKIPVHIRKPYFFD